MEDKTKISLLYMLIGGLLGIVSAFLTVLGAPNYGMLALYIGVVYATTYQYSLVGVKFEKLGEKRWRSALGGVFPSLLPWLVIWTMVFYVISPVVVLAGTSDAEAAEELQEYLESNGVSVKITDNYTRYLFAHKLVIFGSRVPLPLGTSYGMTAFPDAIQRLLRLEKDKGTIKTEEVDSGEIITVKKTGRLIVIISGQKDERAHIAQENRETIYKLLTQ
ncbi:MAG: hypothetical protein HXS48_04715 [Theionarchaea archaeon]|nr:MAG: hypothetical protein AYK19_08495 [Theionarchaea archaeon DG-70-1]MBU7026223.1 hypothetical protein [Theionarchaea archaeon]